MTRRRITTLALGLVALFAGTGAAVTSSLSTGPVPASTGPAAARSAPAAPAAAEETQGAAAPPATEPTVPATAAPPARTVHEPNGTPFASVGPVVLHHASARVERVGFHQSNHEGAQELTPAPQAAAAVTLESRGRITGLHTAADMVVDPEAEVRSPVTGTVKRGGSYTLYCEYTDEFLVIEPDARPGWEVKLLHVTGLRVAAGERVEAGVTVIADRPTVLPFESQVDKLRTAEPAWPHVHLEVVDPSIRNRPNAGSGGSGC